MGLKIFRAVWFLSVLVALMHLLYVYASLQESIVVQEEPGGSLVVSKEVFFYVAMAIMAITNTLVYVIARVFAGDVYIHFRTWFYGQVITLNIFFVIALSLIALYNSAEHFNYSEIGFIIYGSVILMTGWALSWPVYRIFRRSDSKLVV